MEQNSKNGNLRFRQKQGEGVTYRGPTSSFDKSAERLFVWGRLLGSVGRVVSVDRRPLIQKLGILGVT